ncbi:hypothetical protein [Mongoliimonas terrestris]|uniref:hypothetical protein n=1 Tax=Mongoliimonas terrestris TaxID=1709001 RepID=UPI000949786F|nr:hypothetical protein [Mongoliimonas terrestris]
MSDFRARRNAAAQARLAKSLTRPLPPGVLAHGLRQPLIPPTPRAILESYWRRHPLRADLLARALAARSGTPPGWQWRIGDPGLPSSFRLPPAPFREAAHALDKGHCVVCGQPVYRWGWHADLWGDGAPNRNATWHAACVTAWKFWCAPSDHAMALKRRQGHRCAATGKRLLKTAEVDHAVPLYEVWRSRRDLPWPDLLAHWGTPNLQVINRAAHVEKCAREAGARSTGARLE